MHVTRILASALAALSLSCATPADEGLGTLSLALDDAASAYVLAYARVTLSGPSELEFELGAEPTFEHTLTAGVYTLGVADDYRVVRRDAPEQVVPARLAGENPTTVLVAAGETTPLTLHFELEAAPSAVLADGEVSIDVQVSDTEGPASCARYLRISELDYDQAGSDTREFVELSVSRMCDASLMGVALELVNGGDGSVYARYDLSAVAPTLAADGLLVVGDADVLASLPRGTPSLVLNGAGLQNGPDGLRLVRGSDVLDSVAYEGAITGVGQGEPAPADDADQSLTRCGLADDDARAFRLLPPSPGVLEACP